MTPSLRRSVVAACAGIGVAASMTGWLLACGPLLTDLLTVERIEPAHTAAYANGQLGVVRPRFARKYFLQAYRRLSGRPPLPNAVRRAGESVVRSGSDSPQEGWFRLADTVLDRQASPDPGARGPYYRIRRVGNYQSIENCLASEAIAWARSRPGDGDAAEALAQAVEGARWACGGVRNPDLSRRAFQTLHRQVPAEHVGEADEVLV